MVQRICEVSGCSSCAVDRTIHDEACWSKICFTGVPAETSVAEAATKELIAKGYTPMLYDGFSKRTICLNAEPFQRLQGWPELFRRIYSELEVVLAYNAMPNSQSKSTTWKF